MCLLCSQLTVTCIFKNIFLVKVPKIYTLTVRKMFDLPVSMFKPPQEFAPILVK